MKNFTIIRKTNEVYSLYFYLNHSMIILYCISACKEYNLFAIKSYFHMLLHSLFKQPFHLSASLKYIFLVCTNT